MRTKLQRWIWLLATVLAFSLSVYYAAAGKRSVQINAVAIGTVVMEGKHSANTYGIYRLPNGEKTYSQLLSPVDLYEFKVGQTYRLTVAAWLVGSSQLHEGLRVLSILVAIFSGFFLLLQGILWGGG